MNCYLIYAQKCQQREIGISDVLIFLENGCQVAILSRSDTAKSINCLYAVNIGPILISTIFLIILTISVDTEYIVCTKIV